MESSKEKEIQKIDTAYVFYCNQIIIGGHSDEFIDAELEKLLIHRDKTMREIEEKYKNQEE